MSTKIVEAVAEVANSEIISKANPTLSEVTFAYAAISHMEKLLAARKEQLREILLTQAQKHGTPVGEKGAMQLVVNGTKVVRERKTSTTPDSTKLKMMIKERGISVDAAFDEVTVYELNPSKLQYLIDTGKLDGAEVEQLKSVTPSLKVTASNKVKQILQEVAPLDE
jgi:hypothetical protein